MEDFPVAVDTSAILCSGNSPGYESEDSGTGSSVPGEFHHAQPSTPSLRSPLVVSSSESESGDNDDLFAEMTTVSFGNLIDTYADADLLTYLTQPSVSQLEDTAEHAKTNVKPKKLSVSKKSTIRHPSVMEFKGNSHVDFQEMEMQDTEKPCDEDDYDFIAADSPPVVENTDGGDLNRLYESTKNYATRSTGKNKRENARVLRVVRLDHAPIQETRSKRAQPNPVEKVAHASSPVQSEHSKRNAAAEQARLNRLKKKEYVGGLESQVSKLQKENSKLRSETGALTKEKDSLNEEVAYLKSVIANQSALSGLLKNINATNGVTLSTSFKSNRKHSSEQDHDYGNNQPMKRARVAKNNSAPGGVCLHVDKNSVSLEFCAKCANMSKSGEQDHR